MTNLEAIKSTVAGYPLSADTFNRVLIDRGLAATGQYSGNSQAFELAKADMYMTVIAGANVSEGGYSVSVSDKKALSDMANAIYKKWDDPGSSSPTVKDATAAW